jgi:predicted amidohydrolase
LADCDPRAHDAQDSNLRWIFVGTGAFGDKTLPANRGYLLDRLTGQVLVEQDKLFPFTLSEEQLEAWNLSPLLGREPISEAIARGDMISVAESAIGRLVILVCEDLSRLDQLLNPLVEHGVSLAIAPVLSKPTLAHHWEHARAKVYADAAGTSVVIANSLVIASLLDQVEAGTALVHGPGGFACASAGLPDEVVLLRVDISDPIEELLADEI